MALAIKFQDMIERGEVRDYADLARLGYVTRARITQIMNLLLLAPDLQERNQISRAERDAELVEARASIAEFAAQMQRLPDPDAEIRRIEAEAKAESREPTADEQAQIQAIEARPETVTQRVARNKLDHRIGLTINRDLKPAYIRASLISIDGFQVDDKPAAKPWDSLIRSAPDELIDELYLAANLNSGLTGEQEKNSQSPSPSPAVEDGGTSTTTASSAASAATM
jgi:hypothetical protein